MRDDGTTLSDDIHELYVYKVWSLAVSHLNLHTPEATLTYGSELGGFQWAGQRIQGSVLVDDSRTAVGRLLSCNYSDLPPTSNASRPFVPHLSLHK